MQTSVRPTVRQSVAVFTLLVIGHLLAGCAGSSSRGDGPSVPAGAKSQSDSTQVIRYGRYTFVELLPTASQQNLMQQVIDLTVPAGPGATVGDALRFVLLHSGYTLCEDREETRELESFPLPAAHVHIGPLMLRDALQLLVGRAWQLEIDEGNRKVCVSRRQDPAAVVPSASARRSHASKPSRKITQ